MNDKIEVMQRKVPAPRRPLVLKVGYSREGCGGSARLQAVDCEQFVIRQARERLLDPRWGWEFVGVTVEGAA